MAGDNSVIVIAKNPYQTDTPEWQLWERAASLEAQSRAWDADADRLTQKAASARVQAAQYRAALETLRSAGA